ATGEASRFAQLREANEASPRVTRERMYLDTIEGVMKGSRKVVIDSKSSGNMIYLPLDKLTEGRSRDTEAGAPAGAAAAAPTDAETVTVDGRQRGER
ncbi:MAG: protease modulator HflK, partial [Steroidobacteraceae bacterium]